MAVPVACAEQDELAVARVADRLQSQGERLRVALGVRGRGHVGILEGVHRDQDRASLGHDRRLRGRGLH